MSKRDYTWEEHNAIEADVVEPHRIPCYIHKRGDAATASHREAGWPMAPNRIDPRKPHKCMATPAPTTENAGGGITITVMSTKPVCDDIATWKIEKKCKQYLYTSYYCDAHIDQGLRR
jgi:hypothetical protein